MVSDNIEKLLEKYDNGESTTAEEQTLRTYFLKEDVAPHLESYRVMFQYFVKTKEETFTKKVSMPSKKRSYAYQWISVAAIIVILFGIFIQFNNTDEKSLNDLTKEQQIAYNQTKEALDLISTKFNQGASNVMVLGVVGEHFGNGVEKIEYVKQFSKTTNKILKTPSKTNKNNN